MAKITIYPEEPCLIPITFTANPFLVYNKDFADIEEVMISLKINAWEDDGLYLRKYYKDGAGGGAETGDVLVDSGTFTFTLNKLETDVLEINTYKVFLGVKVAGLTKMLWLRVEDNNEIEVVTDGIIQ